jgi:hypothetical protein
MPPHAPIFSDCAFPADCQCAPRGYEHERDCCAVPAVSRAAAHLLGPRPSRLPAPVATAFGTVQPLPHTGDLPADVLSALRGMTDTPYDVADVARILAFERLQAGLAAEAG